MVQKIEIALAKEIKKIFENEKIYMEKVRQGLELPCIYLSLINSNKKKVAYIDYMQTINLDIQYIVDTSTNDINKSFNNAIEKLNTITKFYVENIGEIEITLENIDVVDDVLHYQVELNVPLQNQNNNLIRKSTNKVYSLIVESLEKITRKKCFYINGDLEELENSFFVVEPSQVETNNIGLSGLKEYTRDIQIRYVSTDLSIDVPDYLENVMDKLLLELKKVKGIVAFNYDIDIEYESEEFKNLSVISHEISLHLRERKI